MSDPKRQNVLIVDDAVASLKMAAHIIGRPNLDIFLAQNGKEALEMAGQRCYDLFLLDVMMPEISGFELCTQLKSDPLTAETPVIFLTAIQDEASLIKGFELGAADYVSKPFNPQELNARVGTQLKLSAQRRELRQKIVDLELANQQLDSFSYSASHDLKSPLNAINSYLSLMKGRYYEGLDADGRTMVERMMLAGQRMNSLIEDLLALSRATTELNVGLVDLSQIAHSQIEELTHQEPTRKVIARIQPGVSAFGDHGLMHSVMQNLFSNAWKYSAKRPLAHIEFGRIPPPESRFELKADEDLFFVRDDGVGFDPGLSEKLFQPFKRLHSSREFEGHGIGLATVKRILTRHNGRIWAESQPDQGATFWFTLPALRSPSKPID